MEQITIHSIENLKVYNEAVINRNLLWQLFLEDPYRIVYATRNDRLIGTITLGDFTRYCKEGTSLIQNHFTYLMEEDRDKADDIFNEPNSRIYQIPIVDHQMTLQCEYSRPRTKARPKLELDFERLQLKRKSNRALSELLRNFEIESVLLVQEKDYNQTILNYIYNLLKDNFSIRRLSFHELEEEVPNIDKRNTIIIDMDDIANRHYLRTSFFHQHSLQYIGYKKVLNFILEHTFSESREDYLSTIVLIGTIYGTIAISGKNSLALKAYEILKERPDASVYLCEEEDLIWNEDKQYFYNHKCDIIPEILISFDFRNYSDYVVFQQKQILHFKLQSVYSEAFGCDNWSDYDIAYNIIPELLQNGVLPIVVEAPDMHIDQLIDKDIVTKFKDKDFMWDVLIGKIDLDALDEINQEKLHRFMIYDDYADVIREFNNLPLTMRRGYPELEDYRGKYFNIIDTNRYTVGSSTNRDKNKIYMFGPCTIFGSFVKDNDTVGSYLQQELDGKFCVVNSGNYWPWRSFKIRSMEYRPGDIVIIMTMSGLKYYKQKNIELNSIIDAYNRIPDLENNVWDILGHNNCKTSPYIADELKKIIEEKYQNKTFHEFDDVKFTFNKSKGWNRHNTIENWLNSLEVFPDPSDKRIGCIVMNCNPFTYGHRYLIERAIEKVDYLYIFVVEENKSFFSFEDRFNMVRLGVEELNEKGNIKVLPSGSFIISSTTLPGYFEKDQLQDVVIDMTQDVRIFAEKIAPFLNISIRFVGEEPLDKFTNQYNDTMYAVLPQYGIEFHVIKRKELYGAPISASRVRKNLLAGDYENIKNLVPKTTYEYLNKLYKG